jgi:hypothetical protein
MRNAIIMGFAWATGSIALACNSNSVSREADAVPAPPSLGWTLRDDVPYARMGHAAILDEENDRMIVFGGAANDTWELPLSGPNANVWKELAVAGELPPSHWCSGLHPDSVVYDRRGHRLLAFVSADSFYGGTPSISGVWQLSLKGAPVWSAIVTTGDAPESRAKLALDVDGNRLFAVSNGVWSMPLDAMGAWTRLAELPSQYSYVRDGAAVIVEQGRHRLVVSSITTDQPDSAWALSLDTNGWARLGQHSGATGSTTVFDEKGARFITYGSIGTDVYLGSLELDALTVTAKEASSPGEEYAAGVVDTKRNRIVYFGGRTNVVSSIDLDAFEWAEVVPQTRVNDVGTASTNFVWDPVRSRVVSFGEQATKQRALGASDDWTLLGFSTTSSILAAPVYDSVGQAIVSFGSYYASATGILDPIRLASAGSAWEEIGAGAGPTPRSHHVGIYDEAHRRMIIHGGLAHAGAGSFSLGDVWALALDGAPAWVPLEPEGQSPPERRDHVGIYDPEGQRMIVYGGSSGPEKYTDLWSLSLGDAPHWTELTASGRSPGVLGDSGRCSAVYDAEHRRMVVVAFSGRGAARVFALELGDALAWHEFCSPGITPSLDVSVTNGNAVLVPDGLFLSTGGASFRFDLDTPYCDG